MQLLLMDSQGQKAAAKGERREQLYHTTKEKLFLFRLGYYKEVGGHSLSGRDGVFFSALWAAHTQIILLNQEITRIMRPVHVQKTT